MITIESSAIRQNGKLYIGRRHHNCFHQMRLLKVTHIGSEQGFITNKDKFVNRKQAARIALRSKQIKKLNWPPLLYSEDLWEGR